MAGASLWIAIMTDYLSKDAYISECGLYRYVLTRVWDETYPYMVFIMLNPSTADALEDDPTIRRCVAFAKREGYGGIKVVNLCAYRTPSPKALTDAYKAGTPIGGMENLQSIIDAISDPLAKVVCAWGANEIVDKVLLHSKLALTFLAEEYGKTLWCLGTTKDGHPKHPLYLAADTRMRVFE